MDLEIRKAVTAAIKACHVPDIMYALMVGVTRRQVITLLEPRKSPLSAHQPLFHPPAARRVGCRLSCWLRCGLQTRH